MIDRFRLPLTFDVAPLIDDLRRLGDGGWMPHFNTGYYSGEWSGVVLHGRVDSRPDTLFTGVGEGDWTFTAAADACPVIRAALGQLHCPLKAVRLLRLAPGAHIHEHRDYDLGFDRGEARLHLPLLTNDAVSFHVANRPVIMAPGELWYLDLSQPHRVHNGGETSRVHLVIDVVINDWLRERVPFEAPDSDDAEVGRIVEQLSAEQAIANYALFRERAIGDPVLQARLFATSDRQLFTQEMLRLGVAEGLPFRAEEVERAVSDGRQSWRDACRP